MRSHPPPLLLWTGQPRGGIRLRGQDALLIPFSLLWGGFAIFWEVMALTITTKAPRPMAVVFPLFGLPFVVIGLYLIFGRFIVNAQVRARTYYGVTNERIIIISGFLSQKIKSLQLRTLTEISLAQRSNGSGTITFGSASFMGGFFPRGSWPGAGRYAPPCFEMIERSKDVYDIYSPRPTQSAREPLAFAAAAEHGAYTHDYGYNKVSQADDKRW